MAQGTVKWFDDAKGYGFINEDGAHEGEDIFVHYQSIVGKGYRTLEEGDRVEFDTEEGRRPGKLQAVNVFKLI